MQPPQRFNTDRMLVRRIGPDDVTALFESYASDPEATRYLSWPTHTSPAQTQQFVDHTIDSWDSGSEFTWAPVPHGQTELIGALSAAMTPHGVEIGYVLSPSWWGKGLMVEAVTALMKWLRDQPDVFRIWAYCHVDHQRSVRVLERSGMAYEATLRRWIVLPNLSDEPSDAKVFAWIRPEGRASRPR